MADQQLGKQSSLTRRRVSVECYNLLILVAKPETPKSMVPTTKPKHFESAISAKKSIFSRFVFVSSSSSKLSNDSEAPFVALSETGPPRKQKSTAKITEKARSSASASVGRKAQLFTTSTSVKISETAAASFASASTARFGFGFDIDLVRLSHYISVV